MNILHPWGDSVVGLWDCPILFISLLFMHDGNKCVGLGGHKHGSKCSGRPVTAGVQHEGKHVNSLTQVKTDNCSVAAQEVGLLLHCVSWNVILVPNGDT